MIFQGDSSIENSNAEKELFCICIRHIRGFLISIQIAISDQFIRQTILTNEPRHVISNNVAF